MGSKEGVARGASVGEFKALCCSLKMNVESLYASNIAAYITVHQGLPILKTFLSIYDALRGNKERMRYVEDLEYLLDVCVFWDLALYESGENYGGNYTIMAENLASCLKFLCDTMCLSKLIVDTYIVDYV